MNNNEYGYYAIEALYHEGEIDCISMGDIFIFIDSDENEIDYNKPREQVFHDTTKLISYLLSTGDFCIGHMKQINGEWHYIVLKNGYDEWFKILSDDVESGADFSIFDMRLRLKKINNNPPPAIVPDEILELFKNNK